MITGQVVFREAGKAPTNDGRILMAVVGIIAVDPGCAFRGEHQYTVSGGLLPGDLRVDIRSEKDVTRLVQGHSVGGILTQPIWRC